MAKSSKTKNKPEALVDSSEIVKQAAGRFIFTGLFMFAVLFSSAGKLNWWEAWAYIAVVMADLLISRTLLLIKHPDRVQERMNAANKENVKDYDRVLVPFITLAAPMAAWILAGLDERFGWTPDLPDMIQMIALGMILAGVLILSRATFANRNFSSHVRIQNDRGHEVAKTGLYRYIRHPGYAGEILSWLAVPVFFSSYWVAIPSFLAIAAYIIRTNLEDRTLQDELPGYIKYTQEVKYRLLPGIW